MAKVAIPPQMSRCRQKCRGGGTERGQSRLAQRLPWGLRRDGEDLTGGISFSRGLGATRQWLHRLAFVGVRFRNDFV